MVHRSTKIIAVIGGVFFCASIFAFVGFFSVVEARKESFAGEQLKRAEAKALHESLDSLMRTLDETKEDRASLSTRVLREEDVIDLLALIEALGREQGVTLTTDALTVEPVNNVFENLVVSVSVTGGHASVMHTLKLLENLPYQTSIRQVQLRLEGESGSEWKSSYDVRVTKFKKYE